MGERTTPQAVLWIARSLFRERHTGVQIAIPARESRCVNAATTRL